MSYEPKKFETKWREKWDSDSSLYRAVDFSEKEKCYVLVEFPYPSGPGMHIGHTRNYSMMDAYARLKRMKGYNVLYPMGWDAFGLPTENYAIKTKRKPQDITKENTDNFRRQLKSLGLSFDWEREINTSDPSYYKWTQWIFLKLYEKGLAYRKEAPVNWCPKCKVVCSNEEVVDNKHERCGENVERRNMFQWWLKITAYADRLADELDLVDYPESVVASQRNWIGRSYGAEVDFNVENSDKKIRVFTTRPDTLFGCTYMVLSPEYEGLEFFISQEFRKEVEEYQKQSRLKSDLERTDLAKEKTGVFTGAYALNPVNGKKVPIWISDYVLSSYGTGAIMAVPAHDQRDWDFAKKYGLEIIQVIDGGDIESSAYVDVESGIMMNSEFLNGLSVKDSISKMIDWLSENGLGEKKVNYHLRDWIFSRQHYWGEPFPIVHCEKCGIVPVPETDLPVVLPDVGNYEPTVTGESPLANIEEWVNTKCPKCGGDAKRETDTMPNWAGSSWYFLRYCDPMNTSSLADIEKLKYWMPVDIYDGGAEHVTLHLLYSRFWHKFLNDIDVVPGKEPYSKRRIHGFVLGEGGVKMSKTLGNVINPDDLVTKYGADTARAYVMFMGPYDGTCEWSDRAVQGVYRFLGKFYDMVTDRWNNRVESSEEASQIAINRLIKKVEDDILALKFNTAIASCMEFVNNFRDKSFSAEDLKKLIVIISPIAPFLAEELWSYIGESYSVHLQQWPLFDTSKMNESTVEIPVQINGKIRGRKMVSQEASEEEVMEALKLEGYFDGKEIKKVIYVKGKIINIVCL